MNSNFKCTNRKTSETEKIGSIPIWPIDPKKIPQGETVGAVSPSAPADPSKPDEAWGQGAGSAWWAGAAEDGSVGTSSSSRDGVTNDPLGESVPDYSDRKSVV